MNIIVTSYHLLVCNWCSVALPTTEMHSHLQNSKHKGLLRFQINKEEFISQAKACHIAFSSPPPPKDIYPPPLCGLGVFTGLQCSICSTCRSNKKSMHRHYNIDHSEQSKPSQWQPCHMQRFCSSSAWFKVQSPISAPLLSSPSHLNIQIQNIISTFEQNTYPALGQVEDQRLISPWLRTTQWHAILQDIDIDQICSLVAMPTKQEYPHLSLTVHIFFQTCVDSLAHINILAKQILNTDDIQAPYVASH